MRIPGAALLILIGLLLLWVAVTGRLDKLAQAWTFLQGKGDLPTSDPQVENINNTSGVPSATMSPASRILNPEVWHGNAMALALNPVVAMNNPGGLT